MGSLIISQKIEAHILIFDKLLVCCKMIYGETIHSVDDLNRLTGINFTFVHMKINMLSNGDRHLYDILDIPKTLGVYVHFCVLGGKPMAIYAGKCESNIRGMHKRIQNEFYYSNNEKCGRESGPLAVFNRLKRHGIAFEWAVAYAEVWNAASVEASILDKINFIGNSANNCGLRLYVLDSIVAKLKTPESVPSAPVKKTSEPSSVPATVFTPAVNPTVVWYQELLRDLGLDSNVPWQQELLKDLEDAMLPLKVAL